LPFPEGRHAGAAAPACSKPMPREKEAPVEVDLAPYTRDVATRPDRLDFRRGVSFMPTSAALDRVLTLLSVPLVLATIPVLMLCGFVVAVFSPLFNLKVDPSDTNRSNKQGGSMTARGTMIWRAAAAGAGFGPDQLASKLVPIFIAREAGPRICALAAAFGYFLSIQWRLTKTNMFEQLQRNKSPIGAGVTWMQARTCWFDDVVESFAASHPEEPAQVVFLGAGYDTRSYRLTLPKAVRCFEVDAAGTQLMKREMLQELGTDVAGTVFVSVDFEHEEWMDRLREEGFRADLPTCFVMEGLTYYLTEDVLVSSLREVSKCGRGSVACFDFIHPEKVFDPMVQNWFKNNGEPWKFGLKPERLEEFVQKCGFKLLESPDFATLYDRCVPKRPNGLYIGYVAPDLGAYFGLCVAGN